MVTVSVLALRILFCHAAPGLDELLPAATYDRAGVVSLHDALIGLYTCATDAAVASKALHHSTVVTCHLNAETSHGATPRRDAAGPTATQTAITGSSVDVEVERCHTSLV